MEHATLALDASQEAAATVLPHERQIIIAGPGAGKTQVIGALATRLVETHGIYPEEILVISFSRAAVAAVLDRTEHIIDEGNRVVVTTFDAVAAHIIRDSVDEPLAFAGYEATIQRALECLADRGWTHLDTVRHLIIDEVQDVAGLRAEFALEILRNLPDDVGFTLLGDPLQALYDFQVSTRHPLTAESFLQAVRERFSPTERRLVGQYRARTADAHRASSMRSALLSTSDLARRQELLNGLLSELAPMGPLDAHCIADLDAWTGSTVLLCDTNARAALVFDRLMAGGLPVELASGIQHAGIAPWVARVAHEANHNRISRNGFLEVVNSHERDPEARWLQLVHISQSGRDLDVTALAHALTKHTPRELLRRPLADHLASTVHRAKGLEFDNVVIVDVDDWRRDRDGTPDSNDMFVALSRARARLSTVTGVDTRGWSRQKRYGGIWIKGFRNAITATILDPELVQPIPGAETPTELESLVGQQVIWSPPEERADPDGELYPVWTASVGDSAIAATNSVFGSAIARATFTGAYPDLEGGWVEGLETSLTSTSSNGVRLWTGARVSGPVTINWRS